MTPPAAAKPAEAAPPTTAPPSCSFRPIHHGFYLRLTSGFGEVSVTGTAPGGGSASVSGFSSQLVGIAIGGSPAPGFAIGVDLEDGSTTGTFRGGPQVVATTTCPGPTQPTTETLSGHAEGNAVLVGGFVDWFPNPYGGWHLGGSIGLGGALIRDDSYHDLTSVALGLGASGGYDWWVFRSFSAGLTAFVAGSLSANATNGDGNDSGYRFSTVMFGLGGQVLYY